VANLVDTAQGGVNITLCIRFTEPNNQFLLCKFNPAHIVNLFLFSNDYSYLQVYKSKVLVPCQVCSLPSVERKRKNIFMLICIYVPATGSVDKHGQECPLV